MSTHLIDSSVVLSQRTVKSVEKPLSVNFDSPNLKMSQIIMGKDTMTSFISGDIHSSAPSAQAEGTHQFSFMPATAGFHSFYWSQFLVDFLNHYIKKQLLQYVHVLLRPR